MQTRILLLSGCRCIALVPAKRKIIPRQGGYMDTNKFRTIVQGLAESYRSGFGVNDSGLSGIPDRASIAKLCDLMLHVVFPGFFAGQQQLQVQVHWVALRRLIADLEDDLHRQLQRAYRFQERCQGVSEKDEKDFLECIDAVTTSFLQSLPEVRRLLESDVQAAYENDPSAPGAEEIIVSYPCIEAIAVQRLAHRLYQLEVPFLPRMMTEVAHSRTGIDIHPGATIGDHFFIDHGTGVVIGETTTIGSHVVLYHGVTLGAFNPLSRNEEGMLERGQANKRHPDLEDHVTVYPGATILGGRTRIGHHCIIGGNAWVTRSVAPWSTVTMADPDLTIRQNSKQGPGDFAI
ncbi:MAG: serine acetyltransferase [Planctomycetota bacterium]|nr:MAG: serine acetyltransferase [Planctomycetota bacterium]